VCQEKSGDTGVMNQFWRQNGFTGQDEKPFETDLPETTKTLFSDKDTHLHWTRLFQAKQGRPLFIIWVLNVLQSCSQGDQMCNVEKSPKM
jgi:hypothetical protein